MQSLGRAIGYAKGLLQILWGVIPLSGLGLFLTLITYALWRFYVAGRQDFLLLVLCIGLGILLAVSLLQLLIGILLFFFSYKKQSLKPIQGETQTTFWTNFKLKRLFFTPSLEYSIRWLSPEQIEANLEQRWNQLHEYVLAKRRVEATQVTRQIYIRDLLGLVKFAWRFTLNQTVLIRPNVQRIGINEALKLFSMGDEISHPEGSPVGDYIEMRRYGPGDPVNRILWRVYGRNRKLMVRTPEKAISHRKKTFAYLISGPRDEPSAQTAWYALEKGLLGEEFVFSTDGHNLPTTEKTQAKKMIITSSHAPTPANNLESFFSKDPDTNKANCIIFAPPEPGPWLATALHLAKNRSQPLTVLISIDGFRDQKLKKHWKSYFLETDEHFQRQTQRSKDIFQALRGHRINVDVVDYKTGTLVPHQQLE